MDHNDSFIMPLGFDPKGLFLIMRRLLPLVPLLL